MKRKPQRLAVLTSGKRYAGYIGIVDGEPAQPFSMPNFYDGTPFVELFATRTAASRCYEDVRRVTIVIED